jgi:hypothetical protein
MLLLFYMYTVVGLPYSLTKFKKLGLFAFHAYPGKVCEHVKKLTRQ